MLTTEVMIADAPSDEKGAHGMPDMGGMVVWAVWAA